MSWKISNVGKAIGSRDELGVYFFLLVVAGAPLALGVYLNTVGLAFGWAAAAATTLSIGLIASLGFSTVRVVFVFLKAATLTGLTGLVLFLVGHAYLGKSGRWLGLIAGLGLGGLISVVEYRKHMTTADSESDEQ